MTSLDYLVVGAGLAGLHCALRLSDAYPKARIAIAEQYKGVGGRIYTYTPKEYPAIHWESGAGRVHTSHTRVKAYLDHYGLHTFPLPSNSEYRFASHPQAPLSDPWPAVVATVIASLTKLPPSILAKHSIRELLTQVEGTEKTKSLLSTFPYRAEVDVMRADMALQSLSKELGSMDHFFIVKEGLSSLAKAMRKDLERRGVQFLFEHTLISVKPNAARFRVKESKRLITLEADTIVLALHNRAMKQLFPQNPLFQKIIMCPLLRIYGIFDKAWFSGLPKTVSDSPLRFVIPISERDGTIMVSYTDASDTQVWSSKSEHQLKKELLTHLRALFPERTIPPPLFLKSHLWAAGCSYWAPGSYDPETVSKEVLTLMPSVYVCGESWSLNQAWMEGALEHAELLLTTHLLPRK